MKQSREYSREVYLGIDSGGTKSAVTLGEFTKGKTTKPDIIDKIKFPTNPQKNIKRRIQAMKKSKKKYPTKKHRKQNTTTK